MALPEVLGEPASVLEVIQRVKPIDKLTEPMLESSSPFFGRLPFDGREDRVGTRVLKFDQAIFLTLGAPNEKVRGKITQQGKLEGQSSGGANKRDRRANRRCVGYGVGYPI